MEAAGKKGDQKTLFRIANELAETSTTPPGTIKNKTGEIIEDLLGRQKRWVEHFREMLNRESPKERARVNSQTRPQLNISMHEPTVAEVELAIKALKNGKASGLDQVQAEMLKRGGDVLVKQLHEICVKVWRDERSPKEWSAGIIIPIHKKGDKMKCENYRGITLTSIPGKVFGIIILNRIKACRDVLLRDNQAGFRGSRSCNHQIFAMRQLKEKSLEFNLAAAFCFIDFKAAFDSNQFLNCMRMHLMIHDDQA